MTKIRKIIFSFAFLGVLLTSCSYGGVHYESDKYCIDLDYKNDFKILQLSDLHLGMEDDLTKHFDFISLTLEESQPDLIVLTGDILTFATENVAHAVFSFFNNYCLQNDAYWSPTWGNHDEQVYYSFTQMCKKLGNKTTYSRCAFIDYLDDDVYGNANYVLRLMDGSMTKFAIYILDSNRYHYGSFYEGKYISYTGYDYIHQDQIEWYERMVNHVGQSIPSFSFFHIPLPEYATAIQLLNEGSSEVINVYTEGTLEESASIPLHNSGLFDKMVDLGSTKAIFVGHDHINNTQLRYKGIDLVYGIHATNRVYTSLEKMGGLVVTIHADNSYDIQRIYHSYDEVN